MNIKAKRPRKGKNSTKIIEITNADENRLSVGHTNRSKTKHEKSAVNPLDAS